MTPEQLKNSNQMTFVVSIVFPPMLEPSVVRNYMNMALKKYDKAILGHGQSGYFDGVRSRVGFSVTEVPGADPTNLREIISQIKLLVDHFEKVD